MNTILGLFSGIHQNFKELMIILVVGLVIIALIKWPNGRIFVFTFCGLALVAFSIYAGSYLNYYYNATGGIYGKIESLYKPNQVQITDSVNYSFSNVTMTQDFDDHYSARIESTDVLDFNMDEDATYVVYVNGVPCKDSTVQEDYILAYYEYVFYGEDLTTVLMQDTLTLKFAFYTNLTTLIISTDGGAEAVKYWNYYFNKNVFEVTINNEGFDGFNDFGINECTITLNSDIALFCEQDSLEDWVISADGLMLIKVVPCGYYFNFHNQGIDGLKRSGWTINGVQTNSGEIYDTASYVVKVENDLEFKLLYLDTKIDNPNEVLPCFEKVEIKNSSVNYDFESNTISMHLIGNWTDGENTYYSYDNLHYVLDSKNMAWLPKTWYGGPIFFRCASVWTDGIETYYSDGTAQYVLNKETSTWKIITWTGLTDSVSLCGGRCVLINGKVYCGLIINNDTSSCKYFYLIPGTTNWEEFNWDANILVYSSGFWCDKYNVYYTSYQGHYIVDLENFSLTEENWNCDFDLGNSIRWVNNDNIYFSDENNDYLFLLNKCA